MTEERTRSHLSMFGATRLRWAVCILLIAMFAVLAGFRTATLWRRHDEIFADNRRRAESLALVLSRHLEQTIATVDTALAQLALHSGRVGGPDAAPALWNPVLEAAYAGLAGVRSLTILNESGHIAHSTVSETVGQSRAGQFLFRHIAKLQPSQLVADTPFRSQRDGRVLIPLGRRLAAPDGSFQGVAVATIDPEQLRSFYRSVDVGRNGIVSVLHPAGIVLFREPSTSDPIGDSARESPLFTASRESAEGGFLHAPLEPGGPALLSAYRRLSQPQLLLAVSLNESDVFAEWLSDVRLSATGLAGIGLFLLIVGFVVNREIRARAAADAELRENRARFHELMYRAPMLVSLKDTRGRLIFMNSQLERLLGTSLSESSGKTLVEIIDGVRGALISSLDQEVIDTKTPLQRELSYQARDGTRTALFVKFPLLDSDGNVDAVASFSTDLTEQRRAETWFKTIMDNAPTVIVVKDIEGRFIFANRTFEPRVGMKSSEVLGKTAHDLFPAHYANQQVAYDREVIAARKPIQRELVAPYPEGPRTVLFIKFPILDSSGKVEAVGSISTDITTQKQTEMQLAHSQRMEAVGQLTGGIAHDFNNLLTVILGNTEIMLAELKHNERLQPLAQVTLDAAERSAALTQRLLAFGRRQVLEPGPTDINQLVENMEDLIAGAAGERVVVSYRLGNEIWPALVDPVQLETAIVNLVVNSRDAMPRGGRATIETRNVVIGEDDATQLPEAKAGEYVSISVTDTGEGMPPHVVARAFEPFFTTKEVGKGTGLGLPTIYGFMKQSGGHVSIQSEVGLGTAVRLFMPRAEEASLVPDLPTSVPEQPPRGDEAILLVDDNKLVREHTESQLRSMGYRVVCAATPKEALQLARLTGKPDLLLTDVLMPGGENGRDLAAHLRKHWPDLKVLCTSGFADGALPGANDANAEGLHFLAKPFRRRDLALKVREVLDAPVQRARFSAVEESPPQR